MRLNFLKKGNNKLFPIEQGSSFGIISTDTDYDAFEESFANYKNASDEEARGFVGSIISKSRFSIAGAIVILCFSIFIGMCGYLQILKGDDFRAMAENNRFRTYTIPANRGIIYDRRGVVLTRNNPVFQIISSKELLPSKQEDLDALFENLSALTGIDKSEFFKKFSEVEYYKDDILLASDIDYEVAMQILSDTKDFNSIKVEIALERNYVTDIIPSLSHILGYVGVLNESEYQQLREDGYRSFDIVGKQGLEDFYESSLRGFFGKEIVEVDASGQIERAVSRVEAEDGKDLHITIDTRLQKLIEESIESNLDGTAASKASVVVMDPISGEILSLVSWPAYDSNLFTGGIDFDTYSKLLSDEDLPLFPRAISGEFPSGSTIKPVYAAAALIEGVITPETSFISTGGLWVSGLWFFPDWRAGGHGVTNVYHAIADSVNTFFYYIGGGFEDFDGLGIERMMAWAKNFGFGNSTGIDLFGESSGFLPSPEWKWNTKGEIWYIGDTYHVAIGQGDFLSTPLQIARSTSVFANDGYLVNPHLSQDIETVSEKIIDSDTADIIKTAMRRTVTQGSATSMQRAEVEVAGKTGTAQWSTIAPNHSWFTGFAPYDNPRVVVTVLVEEGADDSLAIPIARDVFNYWAGLGY
ncbi:penicillin-binding protein 2 [Patescibacteria group bacterium]|nr:penicillin-binding protein 2 [Patescibacteria group bacterium]